MNTANTTPTLTSVSTSLIDDDDNPRGGTDADLGSSIVGQGQLQPARAYACDGRFKLLSGGRRLAAARANGLPLDLVIVPKPENPYLARVVENTARKDLSPVEIGRAVISLRAGHGGSDPLPMKVIAANLGMAVSTLDNLASAVKHLHPQILAWWSANGGKHAEVIMRLKSIEPQEAQLDVWSKFVAHHVKGESAMAALFSARGEARKPGEVSGGDQDGNQGGDQDGNQGGDQDGNQDGDQGKGPTIVSTAAFSAKYREVTADLWKIASEAMSKANVAPVGARFADVVIKGGRDLSAHYDRIGADLAKSRKDRVASANKVASLEAQIEKWREAAAASVKAAKVGKAAAESVKAAKVGKAKKDKVSAK